MAPVANRVNAWNSDYLPHICLLFRHTVGLHIAAWPCGIVPDFAELYGSESITQVIISLYFMDVFT